MIARTNRIIVFFVFALLLCVASASGSSCQRADSASDAFIRTDPAPVTDDDDSASSQAVWPPPDDCLGFVGN